MQDVPGLLNLFNLGNVTTSGIFVFVGTFVSLLLAVPLGIQLGIVIGHVLFKIVFRAAKPRDYMALCDESRDLNEHEDVRAADIALRGPVKDAQRRLLDDTSPALRLPDYVRVP